MKRTSFLLIALGMFFAATSAHAQNGCIDSPECPTAVLASVGGLASVLFLKWKKR
jgi:XrtJ-associated TM-motif-TM protein